MRTIWFGRRESLGSAVCIVPFRVGPFPLQPLPFLRSLLTLLVQERSCQSPAPARESRREPHKYMPA
jgi:hypothetical protein